MEVNEHTEVLIKAIVRGDKKAFGQLFRMWYVRLCLYAESIVRDRDMAEDLVQNLFCMLWEKREEIDIRESMKAYLYRSVYHAALNSLKHEKVKLAFWEFIQKQGSKDENNIEYFIDKENQEIVFKEINRAIDGLPFQCRQIFLLSRFSGKKSQEIAVELGISVRTVEAQLYRAMKRLREELAHLRGSAIFCCSFLEEKGFRPGDKVRKLIVGLFRYQFVSGDRNCRPGRFCRSSSFVYH